MYTSLATMSAAATLEPLYCFSPVLFDEWKAYIDASPKTVETYSRAINQFCRYLNENGIINPDRGDVINYRETLRATKKATTVQAYMSAVKLFFQWTEDAGLYPNIARRVKGAKLDREHKRDALTPCDARKLLNSVDRSTLKGKRDYAILRVILTTGLRTISIIRADIGDVRTVGGCTVLFYQGKGHEEKAIFVKLAEGAEEAVRDYLNARGVTDPKAPLFASTANRNNGGRLTTQSISGIAKSALRGIGINSERLTAHSLRHTAATVDRMEGATLEEVQQLLDHASITTTQIYDHTLKRINSEDEERIDRALSRED